MYPDFSKRFWNKFRAEDGFPAFRLKIPKWTSIMFLRYWTATEKWFGY